MVKKKTPAAKSHPLIKLDIGCGKNKKGPEWIGCDSIKFPGVDVVFDLRDKRWPFEDSSVEEVNATHVVEHLTNFNEKWERVHFFNELHRIMKPGARCTLVFPHWCSNRYYGDPTHKEPFSEMGFYYLSANYRESQTPHTDARWAKDLYTCDFECTWGYLLHPELVPRNQEYQAEALKFWKEAAQDMFATLVCKK